MRFDTVKFTLWRYFVTQRKSGGVVAAAAVAAAASIVYCSRKKTILRPNCHKVLQTNSGSNTLER